MGRIGAVFPFGYAEILEMPAAAAFHLAMRAEKVRWQRFEDMKNAAMFSKFEEATRNRLSEESMLKLSGPGVVVRWQETLSEGTRKKMAECDAELDETFKMLAAAGVLCGADGRLLGPSAARTPASAAPAVSNESAPRRSVTHDTPAAPAKVPKSAITSIVSFGAEVRAIAAGEVLKFNWKTMSLTEESAAEVASLLQRHRSLIARVDGFCESQWTPIESRVAEQLRKSSKSSGDAKGVHVAEAERAALSAARMFEKRVA